ncbi:hypothetical protein D3C73_1397240 [compost metagenome]
MSSRYCVLGSFVEDRQAGRKCSMPCIKSKYYLKDSYGIKYDIVCDNIDCTMKLVRNFDENINKNKLPNVESIRHCII